MTKSPREDSASAGSETAVPEISVIVPFYDNEQHIRQCLDALRDQRDVGLHELIFVNNGSSDRSQSILEQAGQSVRHEERPGAYCARNAGLEYARGSIIAFTDADCRPDPGWLSAIQETMRDERVGVALGHSRYSRQASLSLRLLSRYENEKARHVLQGNRPAHVYAYNNNMAVRASLFDRVGLFKEWRRAADTEFVHRVLREAPDTQLRYVPTMRVVHQEFLSARHRVERLQLYTGTNQQVESFRELSAWRRFRILLRCLFPEAS